MRKKMVMCANNCKIYLSVSSAAASENVNYSSLCKHLNGSRRSVGNKVFVLIDGSESFKELEELRRKVLSDHYGIELGG